MLESERYFYIGAPALILLSACSPTKVSLPLCLVSEMHLTCGAQSIFACCKAHHFCQSLPLSLSPQTCLGLISTLQTFARSSATSKPGKPRKYFTVCDCSLNLSAVVSVSHSFPAMVTVLHVLWSVGFHLLSLRVAHLPFFQSYRTSKCTGCIYISLIDALMLILSLSQ